MVIAKLCPMCEDIVKIGDFDNAIVKKIDDYIDRRAQRTAGLIQDELPELTPVQREQIITGTCPHCWEMMFGGNEE